MPSIDQTENGRNYWRSLQELALTPEFLAELGPEFAAGTDLPPAGTSRRRFLQVMAASVGLAGLTGCRWPKEKIFPYANRPDNRTPGTPVQFATSMDLDGVARGLLATSYDGRPIKIDGNNLHPDSLGATDPSAEASVLELYDPDRSRFPMEAAGGQTFNRTWDEFSTFARSHLAEIRGLQGSGLAFLVESSSSPSWAGLKQQALAAFPQAKWCEYEPVNSDNARQGIHLALGQACRPHFTFSEARVIVALDADLFSGHPAAIRHAREFVASHDPDAPEMSRLYSIESVYSLTGAMADHRFPTPASHVLPVLCRLALELARQGLNSPLLTQAVLDALKPWSETKIETPYLEALAKDILASPARCVICAGDRQPPLAHALAALLNSALGNSGTLVKYTPEADPSHPGSIASITALVEEMNAGRVQTLVLVGGNPLYNAPADLAFGEALKKVSTSIQLSLFVNETTSACKWHVPMAHYLESWGDGQALDGTLCARQPLIHPLYEGKSPIEFLSLLVEDQPRSGYDIVRGTVLPLLPGNDKELAWREFLNNGVLSGTATDPVQATPQAEAVVSSLKSAQPPSTPLSAQNLELIFCRHPSVHDGRFANNGWLQELPEFMTKLTWDNAALVAPATAAELGIAHGEVAALKYQGGELSAPVYIMPGQAPASVALFLGYGRTAAGRVGNGVGFDSYTLRTSSAPDFGSGLTLEGTGARHIFACTQDHHAIDTIGASGRAERVGALIREADLSEYREHKDFASHRVHSPHAVPLWQPYEYNDNRWGMAIDLQKCIGCNACVVSCQAENNIPVVGKEQVFRQREMHWLRLDRYFHGEPDSPEVAHQPVACVHCENAPCEQVCPAGATVHDHDGLNVMVYNRCIGTRYCSNNCPYKVRRFNFFHYHVHYTEMEKMVFNPEVTVRSRGVMEKCTYCTQRIQHAKIVAKNERRPITDGEIRTACQTACPTEAIVFGDLNDPESRVAQLHQNSRSYRMLEELNVGPRTAHLARVRNPNPELVEKTVHEHGSHS